MPRVSNNISSSVGRGIAVDLGTATTIVYVRGEGIVLEEPSVAALEARTDRLLAVGRNAKEMIGRTPANIRTVRPLKEGVIADFGVCEKMLRYFIQQVHSNRFAKPRMVICVPSGITPVEQRAVQEVRRVRRCPPTRLHHRGAHGGRHRSRHRRAATLGEHDPWTSGVGPRRSLSSRSAASW